MIIQCAVHQLLTRNWGKPISKNKNFKWNKDATYLAVFSVEQDKELRTFKEKFGAKILFESKKATNVGHGSAPRNTLVIFESPD